MNRRKFSKTASLGTLSLLLFGIGCRTLTGFNTTNGNSVIQDPFFKLSLAQWSLHKPIQLGHLDPYHFASKAKELGFEGLEYVNGLYHDSYTNVPHLLSAMKKMAGRLLMNAKKYGMENLIIMIDGEGDLAVQDNSKRLESVNNHHKWIDMAKFIGCHSIRVNLFGDGNFNQQAEAAADSMTRLSDYARDMNVNILVENHGGLSSDPKWIKDVMKKVNKSNVGTLPDFGNFCIEREDRQRWDAPCINEYADIYKAVKLMMPYAKGVSAKSYDFDSSGNETKIDYHKMLQVVKDASYRGYIGVEYEGIKDYENGILATKNLLLKAVAGLS